MKVTVQNLYSGVTKTIEGHAGQVEQELLRLYPWLRSYDPADQGNLHELVEHLNTAQSYDAHLDDEGEPIAKAEPHNLGDNSHVIEAMLGHNRKLLSALKAARFLSGGPEKTLKDARQHAWEADGDPEATALACHGLEASQSNLKALRAIQSMSATKKSRPEPLDPLPVDPGHPDAQETADQVDRAFKDRFVLPVELGGKHSHGSLLARDQDTGHTWLLKPGSGGQTPAAGAREELASQSRREAGFWHMADAWGMGQFYPHADLLLINGKEYAAIKLLPWSYHTMDKLKDEDPRQAQNILDRYRSDGLLHRWGLIDFVLGNPDRHAANLMYKDNDVRLIDHGSAMAGDGFDPAHDQNSFTPYYLRAWASGKFSTMDAQSKLKFMPRVSTDPERELRDWIDGLHAEDLDRVLLRYGIDPAPAKARLAKVKLYMTQMPADAAINKVWVDT